VVCLEQPRETAMIPCGHTQVCSACCTTLLRARRPQCPLCRVQVSNTSKHGRQEEREGLLLG
jgi:hypothetical protein